MKYRKFFIVLLAALNFIPGFIPAAHSQTSNSDYGSLIGILPVIAGKKNAIQNPTPKPPTTAPAIPNPTQPIPITTTPSAPGKYPLVRWLLPGGPPPAQTPILSPLTCNHYDC